MGNASPIFRIAREKTRSISRMRTAAMRRCRSPTASPRGWARSTGRPTAKKSAMRTSGPASISLISRAGRPRKSFSTRISAARNSSRLPGLRTAAGSRMPTGIPIGSARSGSIRWKTAKPTGSRMNSSIASNPQFDPGGRYLYWIADCQVNVEDSYWDFEHHMVNPAKIVVATLQNDPLSPFSPGREDEAGREGGPCLPHADRRGGVGPKDYGSARSKIRITAICWR